MMISPLALAASAGAALVAVAGAILWALQRPAARSARLARHGRFSTAGEIAHEAGLYERAIEYFLAAHAPERAARSALRAGLVDRAAALYERAGDAKKAASLKGHAEGRASLSPVKAAAAAPAAGGERVSEPKLRVVSSTTGAPPSVRRPSLDLEPSEGCLRALARVKNVEAVPTFAGPVLQALDDPDASPNAICQEIAKDQGLVTMVLRAANSSFYGARGQVLDVTQALVLIGYESVRQLVVARVSRVVQAGSDPLREMLWRHALASAIAAQACARTVKGVTVGHALTCGLLHDIGRAILLSAYPDEYRRVWEKMATDPRPSSEIERESLGVDHAEIGAALLRSWNLPPVYAAVTRVHAADVPDFAGGLSAKDARLRAIVALASGVASWLGHGRRPARPIAELTEHPSFDALGVSRELADTMAAAVEAELAAYAGIFA